MEPRQIEMFTKHNLPEIRKVIDEALKAALAPFGLGGQLGKIGYTERSFKANLDVTILGSSVSQTLELERSKFELQCRAFGLLPEHYRKCFRSNGEVYTLTGFKPENHKYPIIAVNLGSNKSFKFPMSAVSKILAGV